MLILVRPNEETEIVKTRKLHGYVIDSASPLPPGEQKREELDPQGFLFDEMSSDWKREWWGMPSYQHGDLTPFKQVIVSFECVEDMNAFAALVGQTVKESTRSIWYPQAEIGTYADKLYVSDRNDESPDWIKLSRGVTLLPEVEARVCAYESMMHLMEGVTRQ